MLMKNMGEGDISLYPPPPLPKGEHCGSHAAVRTNSRMRAVKHIVWICQPIFIE